MADSQAWNEVDQKDSRKPLLLGSRIALFLALAFFSTLPVLVKLFAAPQNRTLVLTGHPGELTVMEMGGRYYVDRSEEHTSELQSRGHLVCRLLLEKKKPITTL